MSIFSLILKMYSGFLKAFVILVFKFNITDQFLTLSKCRKNSTIAIFLLYLSLTNFLIHLIILLVFQRVSFGNSSFLFFSALRKL